MNAPQSSSGAPLPEDAIEQTAADWVARLDRGLSAAEAEAFAAWRGADPRHAAEIERLQATWRSLDTADEVPEIMQIAHAVERTENRRRLVRRMARPAGLLGLAAAALAVGIWLLRPSSATSWPGGTAQARTYQVVPSGSQRLLLIDGSVVQLKDGSAVEPAFSANERRVRLTRGEAYFTVAHDASRPFIVIVGDIAVQAVGTAFNIRFDTPGLEVLVTEGRVHVEDLSRGRSLVEVPAPSAADAPAPAPPAAASEKPLLEAGRRIVIRPGIRAPVTPDIVRPVDLERVLAWQGTQFVFDRTPLAEAIAAFNSFNRRQLVLGDPALGHRRLGGTFRADNVDAFVRLLEEGFAITAARQGEDEIVLRAAR